MKSKEKRDSLSPSPVGPNDSCVSKSEGFQRIRKILVKVLYGNCQAYSWFPTVLGLIRSSDWASLYAWADSVPTVVWDTAEEHFAANQLAALVRKLPFNWKTIGLEMSPEDRAKKTFYAAEERCEKFNRIIPRLKRTPYAFKIEYMRRWVHHVLGDAPNLKEVYSECDFGPGSNIGINGNKTNLYRKLFGKEWTVTNAAIPYVLGAMKVSNHLFLGLYPEKGGYHCFDYDALNQNADLKFVRVPYNKISFVPKTAKTLRTIAVEPLLNSYIQKGIDRVLRKRLLKHGYDLADQERNKYLAKVGSVDGSLGTLDLSAASDSISIELVKAVLPPEWFELLLRTRCACYRLDGTISLYHKFCSMGNGFCFPLETLIFAAAARAVMHDTRDGVRTHAVYGDDIIVPSDSYDALVRLLAVLGFKANSDKSFNTGPFRESCGADWYIGQDVRPVYLDYALDTDVSLRIFHNVTYRSVRSEIFFDEVRDYLRAQSHPHVRYLRPKVRGTGVDVPKWLPFDEMFLTKANLNGAFDVEMDLFMGSRFSKWNRDQQRFTWLEVVYTPVLDRPEEGDDENWATARYLACLRGSPEGKLAVRRKAKPSIRRI